jgi:hypothetical protein
MRTTRSRRIQALQERYASLEHGQENPTTVVSPPNPVQAAAEHIVNQHTATQLDSVKFRDTIFDLINDGFECSICSNMIPTTSGTEFTLLRCFHPFCLKCIQKHMRVGSVQTAHSCPLCRAPINMFPILVINRHNLHLCTAFLTADDGKLAKVYGVNATGVLFNNADSIPVIKRSNIDLYSIKNSNGDKLKMFTEVDSESRKALGMNLWVQNDVETISHLVNNAIKRSVLGIEEDKKVVVSLKRNIETMQDKITGMQNHVLISEKRIASQQDAVEAYNSVVSILKKIKTSDV